MGRGTRIAARRIVERSSSAWGVTISLDDLPHNPEDDSYNADDAVPDLSTPAAAEVVEQMDLLEALQAGLDALGPEERKIVRMYYGLDEEEDVSIRQASLRMGIHKNSGKEVMDRALRKLRKALDA
jgi:DNA-directed RNA polymerase sigma subunit (sigma70/sigma32)